MPKIVINEIDKTKAGLGEYANFTVFVPGHAKDYPTDGEGNSRTIPGMDENNVVELTSQEDFKEIIGIVPSTTQELDAVAPILSAFNPTEELKTYSKIVDANDFWTIYKGKLYTHQSWGTTTPIDGHLKLAADQEGVSGSAGIYKLAEEWEADKSYYLIAPENVGRDAQASNPQMGNQIAYELLGLGYTVLYRVIKAPNEAGDDDMTDYTSFWQPYEDKATYDFRYVITGFCGEDTDGTYAAAADNCISKLASERGDCVALVDVPQSLYINKTLSGCKDDIIEFVNNLENANKYSAIFMPTVTYKGSFAEYGGAKVFPAYFHYLVCASNAFVNYPEWFAVAGYTRGISPDFTINSTAINLGDSASNVFEPRFITDGLTKSINIIAKIRGSYYIWGNRTMHTLYAEDDPVNGDLVASHFLNIRQLCTTLKKQLYVTCRRFTFDPNSDTLWINFVNAISPLLDRMKANQGIEDYRIIKVATQQKATLRAKIRIVPIEAVEDFVIDLFLEDSITGANVEIDEGSVSSGN